MTIRLLAAASCRRMPWKNGGGETIEVAVYPERAGLTRFDWRISMARVAVDGPFSAFPDIDRTIAVMDGEGMELGVADEAPRLLGPDSAPFAFPGDAPCTARLTAGPVHDLNVMTRRGRFHHAMQRIDLTGPLHRLAPEGWSFVVCGRGRIHESRSGCVLDGHDTLACDGLDALDLEPLAGQTAAFVIHIAAATSPTPSAAEDVEVR